MRGWQENRGSPTEHDLDLLATFAASWEQVGDEGAQRVFRLAVYCAPNQPIPCELLEGAAGLDATGCDEALARLTSLGLLAMEDPAAGPTIHPLLAEYGRALPEEEEFAPLAALAGALVGLATEANESGLSARLRRCARTWRWWLRLPKKRSWRMPGGCSIAWGGIWTT